MSQFFTAGIEIGNVVEVGGGVWEIFGVVRDESLFGYTSTDVQLNDVIIDENPWDGTINRWKIIEIVSQTPVPDLDVKVIWDDIGTEDIGGPVAGFGAIFRSTPNLALSEVPTVSYAKISESLQTYIRNIDNSRVLDKISLDYKVVTNLTTRDDILAVRRVVGMLCYVVSEGKTYRLIGGIANSNWEEVVSGGSGAVWEPAYGTYLI